MPRTALHLDVPADPQISEGRSLPFPEEHRSPGKPGDLPLVTLLDAKGLGAELISELRLCLPFHQAAWQWVY